MRAVRFFQLLLGWHFNRAVAVRAERKLAP